MSYDAAHAEVGGAGDSRPTAMDIIKVDTVHIPCSLTGDRQDRRRPRMHKDALKALMPGLLVNLLDSVFVLPAINAVPHDLSFLDAVISICRMRVWSTSFRGRCS